MSTQRVTLVANEGDATLSQLVQGKILIAPSQRFPDPADELLVGMAPRVLAFHAGTIPQLALVPNDLVGPQQEDGTPGWTYSATYYGMPGYQDGYQWSFYLLSTNGATQYLSALASVPAAQPGQMYVPLPDTPPGDDAKVLGLSSVSPLVTGWVDQSTSSGTVTSVNDVEPVSGNVTLTAANVGALPSAGGELTGDVTQEGTGQYAANAASGPQMRLGQKANGEIVWSWNVNQNDGDAIDDASLPAWKFSMEGGPDYNGAQFQSSPAGGSWDSTQVFTLDNEGNLVISGELTADGGISGAGEPDGLATLDGTGNVPPGQLGNVSAAQGAIGTLTTGNASEQTLGITQGDYAVVTWGQAQSAQGVALSAADGTVTVLTAGAYAFSLSLLVKRTGTGEELALGFFVNGTEVTEVVGGYGLTAEATQYRHSGSFAAVLSPSDVVTVQATLTDADGTLVVTDGQLTVTAGFSGETTVTLDDDSADIQPLGDQAAGSTGMAADAGHVHPSAGVVLMPQNTPADNDVLAVTSASPLVVQWQANSGADKNYTQDFSVASTVSVAHNLGKYPAVTVLDSAGDQCEGAIEYTDLNNLTVSFSAPFSGTVTCN